MRPFMRNAALGAALAVSAFTSTARLFGQNAAVGGAETNSALTATEREKVAATSRAAHESDTAVGRAQKSEAQALEGKGLATQSNNNFYVVPVFQPAVSVASETQPGDAGNDGNVMRDVGILGLLGVLSGGGTLLWRRRQSQNALS